MSPVIQNINFGIIESPKSYWATHFVALLECLHFHVNLKHSPRKLERFPLWSLSDLRGNYPVNFFNELHGYMVNWGMQYFLVHFLNQSLGVNILNELVKRVSENHDVSISKELSDYRFYISGHDSQLSKELDSRFTYIFPCKKEKTLAEINCAIQNSDICLVLKDQTAERKIGLFGEIEANKGYKLRRDCYWTKKSDFCLFGIGTITGNNKYCYFHDMHHDSGIKTLLFFEQSHFVVSDFLKTIRYFNDLLLKGPMTDFFFHEEDDNFAFFFSHLKDKWNSPVLESINDIRNFISYDDLVKGNLESIPVVANIQL